MIERVEEILGREKQIRLIEPKSVTLSANQAPNPPMWPPPWRGYGTDRMRGYISNSPKTPLATHVYVC